MTEEDTRALKRAHKKADRIMSYAADITLIASFHYKKKNYHLVRLLEPLFIIGRRMYDIKGYYFSLLSPEESDQVRPVLEQLLLERQRDEKAGVNVDPSLLPDEEGAAGGPGGRGAAARRDRRERESDSSNAGLSSSASAGGSDAGSEEAKRAGSRRRWSSRIKKISNDPPPQ